MWGAAHRVIKDTRHVFHSLTVRSAALTEADLTVREVGHLRYGACQVERGLLPPFWIKAIKYERGAATLVRHVSRVYCNFLCFFATYAPRRKATHMRTHSFYTLYSPVLQYTFRVRVHRSSSLVQILVGLWKAWRFFTVPHGPQDLDYFVDIGCVGVAV